MEKVSTKNALALLRHYRDKKLLAPLFYPMFLEALHPDDVDDVLSKNIADMPDLKYWAYHLAAPDEPGFSIDDEIINLWCLKNVRKWLEENSIGDKSDL